MEDQDAWSRGKKGWMRGPWELGTEGRGGSSAGEGGRLEQGPLSWGLNFLSEPVESPGGLAEAKE